MRTITIALVIVISCAGIAAAQVAPFHIVPVIAKSPGDNNTQWLSDISIANTSSFAVELRAAFFREGTPGSVVDLDPPPITTLQAGQTLMVSDVLGAWFPGEGSTKGTLILLAEPAGAGNEEEVKLAVSSRTYNTGDPRGTFGQTVGSGLFAMVFGTGASVLPGVRQQDGAFRTNIGIVNMSFNFFNPTAKTTFLVRTYDLSGTLVAERSVQVEPFSMRQYSLPSLGVSNLAGGRTEVVVDPDTITWDPCSDSISPGTSQGLFIAYMSKVDDGTGDAEFSLGQPDWSAYAAECGDEPDPCVCP